MLLRLRETLVSRDGDSCLLLASPPSSLRVALLPHSFVCATIHKLTTSSVHESGSLFSATMNRETIVTPVTIVFSTVFIAPVAYVRTFAYEVVLVSSHSHVEVFSSPPIHSLALVIVSPSQCRCLVYKTSLWASSIRYVFRLVLLISLFIVLFVSLGHLFALSFDLFCGESLREIPTHPTRVPYDFTHKCLPTK